VAKWVVDGRIWMVRVGGGGVDGGMGGRTYGLLLGDGLNRAGKGLQLDWEGGGGG
jgi:hypothetical protein